MSSRPDESDDEPAADQKITALVRQREVARDRLAERQQEILEQLHRGLQTLSPSYPQLNAVWMQLRGEWSWVVLVPGEPDYSTAELARALSETGTRLSVYPIEVVEAKDLDLDASTRLIARLGIFDRAKDDSPAQEGGGFVPAGHARPITKTIVALESPLANPLALPIALAADGVVLCVRRGRDRIKAVRDTVHALGPERILCCVLVE